MHTKNQKSPDAGDQPSHDAHLTRRDVLKAGMSTFATLTIGGTTNTAELRKQLAGAGQDSSMKALQSSIREDLVNDPRVSTRVRELLQSPQGPHYVERAAQVFAEVLADPTKTINLKEVEGRFGPETRTIVAALLQKQLIDAFKGLAQHYESIVREAAPGIQFNIKDVTTADPNIRIDGDWGKASTDLRRGLQKLLLHTHHFEYLAPTRVAKQEHPMETYVGRQSLALARWFAPENAALQTKTEDGLESLKGNGKREAGFEKWRVNGASFAERIQPDGYPIPEFARKYLAEQKTGK